MEFLKSTKRRRSLWSEVVYVALNISLALAILGVVWAIESPLPAFALVLLSKWRILAVRPRYWFAHVLSNAVDIIVSLSLVVLLYAASGAWVAQIILTALYVLWLLLLKPQSKRLLVVAQAGVGIVVGTMALATVSFSWPVSLVVLLFWVVGFSTARHVITAYEQQAHINLLSLIWAFIVAELGWITYHWMIAYDLVGAGDVKVPQVTVIVLLLSFLAERCYASFIRNNTLRLQDVLLPLLLTASVITILLVLFNSAPTSLS